MKSSNINLIYMKNINIYKLGLIISFDNFIIKKIKLIIL